MKEYTSKSLIHIVKLLFIFPTAVPKSGSFLNLCQQEASFISLIFASLPGENISAFTVVLICIASPLLTFCFVFLLIELVVNIL